MAARAPQRRRHAAGTGRKRAMPLAAVDNAAGTAAIARIKDEHLALTSVLYGLRNAIRRIRAHGAPDFRLLFALLDYIVEFPEQLHHPKEDEYLFRALGKRCANARPFLAELTAEHVRGQRLIATLRDALVQYSRTDDAAFGPFAAAVEDYVAFHGQHMSKEEDTLLPLAQRHLTPDDWATIDAAFRANDNPLAGFKPKAHVELLFSHILALMPARAPVVAATKLA
jgi:hemerythrin-like domain-containing protein